MTQHEFHAFHVHWIPDGNDPGAPLPYAPGMPEESPLTTAVIEHFQILGPSKLLSSESIVDQVELAVHAIEPTPDRPCYTLFTTGMSEREMRMPPELEDPSEWNRAELMVCLPQGWFGDGDLGEILAAEPPESMFWPIRLLKNLAQFPHENASWLAYGQTFPNGDPPQGYADDTALAGCLILWPLTTPQDFRHCQIPGGPKLQIYSLVPLFAEELELELEEAEGLLGLFDQHQVSEVLNPDRPNVAKPADV
jgi:hypothetical protein